MKLANPASWITAGYLRRQAENPELTDAQVLQLHGCVWAASDTTWIAPDAWAARADRDRVLEEGERLVLGFDGSDPRRDRARRLHPGRIRLPDRGLGAAGESPCGLEDRPS
jgi:hypothetical protein